MYIHVCLIKFVFTRLMIRLAPTSQSHLSPRCCLANHSILVYDNQTNQIITLLGFQLKNRMKTKVNFLYFDSRMMMMMVVEKKNNTKTPLGPMNHRININNQEY